MSAHDSHAPVQQTKGIWALPLTAWIIVLVLLVAFTRPIFPGQEKAASHGETEGHKTEATESHH